MRMPFKRPLRTSITLRLVLFYSISTFALLLISSWVLYESLTYHLDRERGLFLADEVATLRQVQSLHPLPDDPNLLEEVQTEADERHFSRYYVRILDHGRTLIESSAMTELLPPSAFPAATADEHEQFETVARRGTDGRRYLVRSAMALAGPPANTLREMQIAIDNTSHEEIAASYRRSMGWTVLGGTLSSMLLAAAIARRGMRPLRDLARRAAGISAAQLHERMGAPLLPAELRDLARAFDQMLERLERSFAQLSQFSADLAHELRTPINNLMGGAEVALSRPRDDGEYRRVLESGLEELGRLARMIDAMLFLARAEGSESPLELQTVEVHQELDVVREYCDAIAEQRRVSVSCSGHGQAQLDPLLFRRALVNLLENALDHTPPGGRVELRTKETASAVEVQVEDTGCGIEAEHLPRLFDRLYRANLARSGAQSGTGLGLALVKSIVELHGGAASIASEPGRGTVVTLHLPKAARRSIPHQPRARAMS